MTAPSPYRAEILAEIARYADEHSYPPSVREIAGAVGLHTTSHVNYLLNQLARDGLLTRTPMVSRGLALTDAGRAWLAERATVAEVAA
jgi:repressor LexA